MDTKSLKKPKSLSSRVAPLFFVTLLVSCGDTRTTTTPENAPALPISPELSEPSTLPAEESDPWRELKVTSDYAEIKIDPSGHYSISRNNCWVAGYGAISLENWQPLEKALLEITKKNRSAPNSDVCFEASPRARALRGPVELQMENGNRMEVMSYSYPDLLCSKTFQIEQIKSLARELDLILPQAFAEDCTLPPPIY